MLGAPVARRTPGGPSVPDGRRAPPRCGALQRDRNANRGLRREAACGPARGSWVITCVGKPGGASPARGPNWGGHHLDYLLSHSVLVSPALASLVLSSCDFAPKAPSPRRLPPRTPARPPGPGGYAGCPFPGRPFHSSSSLGWFRRQDSFSSSERRSLSSLRRSSPSSECLLSLRSRSRSLWRSVIGSSFAAV